MDLSLFGHPGDRRTCGSGMSWVEDGRTVPEVSTSGRSCGSVESRSRATARAVPRRLETPATRFPQDPVSPCCPPQKPLKTRKPACEADSVHHRSEILLSQSTQTRCAKNGGLDGPVLRYRHPRRRSGRIPALPYPPRGPRDHPSEVHSQQGLDPDPEQIRVGQKAINPTNRFANTEEKTRVTKPIMESRLTFSNCKLLIPL